MSNKNLKAHYGNFHTDSSLNFQLNRLRTISVGKVSFDEIVEMGNQMDKYNDVTPVSLEHYEKAIKENRNVEALAFLRLAEFFCFNDEQKHEIYAKFRKLFYDIYSSDNLKSYEVPYENGKLSVIECLPKGHVKDTIVVHGGGDSFIEEFYANIVPLVEKGYRVIMFEGPGQGQPLQKYNIKMTHEWEKPTSAVLDYFNLSDITLIGISLGGYFAARAAAFDKRISRVVLWDVVYEFFECLYARNGMLRYHILNTLVNINAKGIIKKMMDAQMRKIPEMKWFFEHAMHVHGVTSNFDFFKRLKKYSTKNISRLIDQDVLVMAGVDDHVIPFSMYDRQMKALTNARSVRGRVFTKKEHASNHCQLGNIQIAIDEIIDWLESLN